MRLVGGLILGLVLAQAAGTSETRVVRTEFCELLKRAELYDGKEVTFRTTWKYGFEWSYVYCVTCRDNGKVWLDFSDDMDDASQRAINTAQKDAGIVNLSVTGVFKTGGSYGHLGGFRHKFIVRKAWDVVVLSKGMKDPTREKEIEAKWACGGKNSK